jgi:(p)ppGpp synthase/HD superfamily hydrolase
MTEQALIVKASVFAHKAHEGVARKYNQAPYITHPARVAKATAELSGATEEMVAAAWLHDVVEDTAITLEQIRQEFGEKVAELVGWLTNEPKVPGENRAARKKKAAVRLNKAPKDAQRIKMLDRMDNLGEMDYKADGSFARVYVEESWDLFYAISNADSDLSERFETTLKRVELLVASEPMKGN